MTTTDLEIYGLLLKSDPDRIRYVGQTVMGARKRFWAHTNAARNGSSQRRPQPVSLWIRKHGSEQVSYRVLEMAEDESHLQYLEMFWIAQMRELGQADLNIHPGGMGGSRPGTEIERAKRSARLAESRKDPEWESRRLEGLRRTKASAENRKKTSEIMRGDRNHQYGRSYSAQERQEMARIVSTILTEDRVAELKALVRSGVSQKEAAIRYGVKPSTVSHIMAGRRWGWVN